MILASKPSFFPRTVSACALFALVAGLCLTRETRAEQQPAATGPAVTTEAPSGWWKNGTNGAVAYVAGVDRNNAHDGLPSAYVKSIEPVIQGFGGMMQMCAAENFLGKRLRFSAWMKTENTNDGGAHLWFRVDGKETNSMLQFDNMDSRPVKGTTDWQQYAIVLDVPANSAALAYGFFVQGNGQAWVSGVKIEEVGADVPSTNMTKTRPPILPNAPVNLGFVAADQSNLPIQSKSGAILNHMAQLADIPGRNIAVQIKGNGAFDTYTEHLVAALHSCQQKPTGLIELLAAEVGCEISADGHISDVHVVRSSGNSAFDQSCVETFTRVGSAGPTPDGKSGKWTIAFQVADSNR